MKKVILIFTYYIIIFFNSNVFSKENNQSLKIGLLAPLTGEYKDLGNSLIKSSAICEPTKPVMPVIKIEFGSVNLKCEFK